MTYPRLQVPTMLFKSSGILACEIFPINQTEIGGGGFIKQSLFGMHHLSNKSSQSQSVKIVIFAFQLS